MTLRPSPRWVVWFAALELFILAASNGRPFWTSSGAWVTLTAVILLFGQGFGKLLNAAFSRPIRHLSIAMLLFILVNFFSAVANPSDKAFIEVGLRGILPFIVYLSLVGLVLRPSDTLLSYSLAAGAGVMFVRGFFAYVSSVGNLDLHTILWARYDSRLMVAYSEATLGNIGRLGGYIVLVFPVAFWAFISPSHRLSMRFAMAIICALAVANLLFCGSRTGLALTAIEIAPLIMARGARSLFLGLVVTFGLTLATIDSWVSLLISPDLIERFLPTLGSKGQDNSVVERLASIEEGWNAFLDNMAFGIGPGNSIIRNSFAVPHQSVVHQLSELGIIGGTVFIALCLIILVSTWHAFLNASRNTNAAHRWVWSSGPAFWVVFGILAGVSFTASLALAWVGIAYAMLAIGSAKILPTRSKQILR